MIQVHLYDQSFQIAGPVWIKSQNSLVVEELARGKGLVQLMQGRSAVVPIQQREAKPEVVAAVAQAIP